MGAQAVRLSNIDIDNALKNKDFEVLFQPIFDLGNGALARVETFIRWRHAALGVLPPGAFISFFESQGRMSELTRYVLAQALSHYRDWRGPNPPGFSINLALSDLADDAFSSHFDVLLRDAGFPPDLITLECPMPPVTMDVAEAADHFKRLARTGARLAIEVRGRANDFLRQIDPFPFDEIKTGGAAILRFARTVRGPGLSAISELLEIANNANAAITAVGVEDQASLAALRGLGFAAAQGNHLGKVGLLADFDLSRVNDVRRLLGLAPLAADDLAALFRTEAPAPQAAEAAAVVAFVDAPAPAVEDDLLVERLAARLAKQQAASQPAATPAPAVANKPPRAAAKSAAIARARQKAAERRIDELAEALPRAAANAEPTPARELQERLSRAFDGEDVEEDSEIGDEFRFGSLLDPELDSDAPTAEPFADEFAMPDAAASAELREEREEAAVTPDDGTDEDGTGEVAPGGEPPELRDAETAPPNAAHAARAMSARLDIKGARAYFRPGLRVGVGAVDAAAEPPEAPVVIDDDAPLRREAPAIADQADAPSSPPTEEAAEAPAATDRPRRRRKSFLTRTVIPYPTHFWPRSWRRAWKRQAAERARKSADSDALAAE